MLSSLCALSCVALTATPLPQDPARPQDPPRPNVVVVFCDDMGWGDLGVQGAEGYATPNLDRLAAEGVRFSDFYVAQPVCSASRAALLTGCYPNRIGIHGALGPSAKHGIHADETTLAEVCKAAGYSTAAYGKWHLGHHPQFLPTRHGFDDYYGIPYSNDMWPYHPESPKAWPDLPTMEDEEVVGLNTDQRRFTTDLASRAVDFIRREASAGRKFFCYLAHPMPHVPLSASARFRGTTERGLFGDVIAEIDDSVGAVLDALDRAGVADDTLIVFSSDNGPWLSYGDHCGSTGGFREGKGTTWEGGVRVPFLARWPGRIPAGAVQTEPMMTIDVLPTIASLLGVPPGERPIDGLDCWPLWTCEEGATNPHDAYFFYYHAGDLEAMRSGRWKLHLPHRYRTMAGQAPGSGGIPGRYVQRATGLELYDLLDDPHETTDVAAAHPEVIGRLMGLVERERAALGDRLSGVTGSEVREPGRLDR